MNRINTKMYLIGNVAGFVIGFTIVHPFSMLFQGLIHPTFTLDFSLLWDAFNPHHLPMAFFFGVLGCLIGNLTVFLLSSLSTEKEKVKILEGLLPICAWCNKIRDDEGKQKGTGEWIKIEQYIEQRSNADFTHGICSECYEKNMKNMK